MKMAESNIPDYKLSGRFLKEFLFEILEEPSAKELTIRLPVFVQVVRVMESDHGWNLYFLADGEFEMSKCVFMSKQAKPECFSILKVKKISKLPVNMTSNLNENSLYGLGDIEFDTEVSGENIGFRLYTNLKHMDMKKIIKRKEEIGFLTVKETFETPGPKDIMKQMWENRSEKFCDISFTFDEGVALAHRSVLVAASEVFEVHSNNEGFIDNKSVNIVDVSLYSFNKLLQFIYTGKVQFATWRVAFELLYLSKKYLMSHLEKLCQCVIIDFCEYDSENVLKVFEENRKVNDRKIQITVKSNMVSRIYEIINSKSFLNCEFSTVEWMMSFGFLLLNEWTRLCAIYKWALYNGVNAFCERTGGDGTDESDEPRECLHSLLEYVRYEKIDGLSLQRFLNLSKLQEVVDVCELKQSVFDRLLKDGSYLDTGTNYSKYRIPFSWEKFSPVYAEIEIGRSEERKMKDIHMNYDGPVLGFKIKVEQNKLANVENSLDIFPSFRYLYSGRDEKKHVELKFSLELVKTKSRISESGEDITSVVIDNATFNQGEWQEFRMHLKDCRGYLSDRIENFGINSGVVNKSKSISLNIYFDECSQK